MKRAKEQRTSLVSVFSHTHPSYSKSPDYGNLGISIDKNKNNLPFSPRKLGSFPQELNINKLNKGLMKSG